MAPQVCCFLVTVKTSRPMISEAKPSSNLEHLVTNLLLPISISSCPAVSQMFILKWLVSRNRSSNKIVSDPLAGPGFRGPIQSGLSSPFLGEGTTRFVATPAVVASCHPVPPPPVLSGSYRYRGPFGGTFGNSTGVVQLEHLEKREDFEIRPGSDAHGSV